MFALLFGWAILRSQSPEGAWETSLKNEKGINIHHVIIISDGHIAEAFFEKETGAFIGTWGGTCKVQNNNLDCTYEFASFDSSRVGTSRKEAYQFVDNQIRMGDTIWTQIDDGTPGKLSGAWLISGRMRDGKIQQRDTDRPRKTMKILSGTRFQWIAYNTETQQFMGTGGGTYTTENGKYTENIDFFSKDNSRVGASLSFDFKIKEGNWHHSGESSRGKPIYEVWSPRKLH